MRAGEGVGLEPGDVDDGPVRGRAARAARAATRRLRSAVHACRSRDVVLLLPRPALVGPPLAPLVAAALDERQLGGVGDRGPADQVAAHVGAVARALVVVGEARRRRRRSCTRRPGPRPARGPVSAEAARSPAPAARPGARYPASRASWIVCSIVSLCWCSWRSTISCTKPSPTPRSLDHVERARAHLARGSRAPRRVAGTEARRGPRAGSRTRRRRRRGRRAAAAAPP